ncbi:STAS domain-containing protein [Anaeroselena agilis]|uniref:Anti-sigma factor antagonist n=1 Tax=Anaeroselena agilis TaxID=3063788 RepID=A0ABU3NUG6_9FIRM|nr:STAS domain-containing protein [Selenomonadales bacterium 4137-cl]
MKFVSYQEKGFLVVKVEGRMDIASSPEFEKSCATLIEQGHQRFVIDFSGLEYISSAGLRSILAIAKKLKGAGGSLSLCSLTGLVKEVFDLSGFDNFLPVFADVEQALAGGGK